ncbi:hypothetical protein C2S52_014198 [Perilla frutescens var. hirtella]|nr:hypothetical protein C2S52_014198 [Perilla frutescens var. hirtella]
MRKPSICSPLMVLLLLIILASTPSSRSNNETDFEALLAFKKAIRNDPLGALSSWNETTHFCRWNGVGCSKRHQNRVVSVYLRDQGLVGSLSPHIGNLSFLRIIDLKNNSFDSQIPEEIGRLRRLHSINFSNNSFSGGIPRNVSQCKNLHYLNLIDNQLTGSIIPEIGSLVNLVRLSLTINKLSGSIPPFLGNLTSLTQLSIGECGLQGDIPESLAQLRRMEWLNLRQNNLTGLIPLGLYNLSSVDAFVLSNNRLHGTIHSDIVFTLPKLRILNLGLNHFTGELPSSLANSSRIEEISVFSNNFTGEMMDFRRLSALQYLIAPLNNLKGDMNTVLSSLENCTNLQALLLADNLFTGLLPDSIGNLSTHLRLLDIGNNQISGSIPSTIGSLVNLTILRVAVTNLHGPIPWSIGKLVKLQHIFLHENMLTNEMPSSFGNLTLLNHLLLWGNDLLGNIPQSLGNCSNLLQLDLSHNNLNGSIPPQIMRLSSISITLDLSYNVLMGTIPSEVGALRNLGTLDLSHNRLSGLVPSSLSSCVMLERLHLQSNSIQGEIPDSLKALRGLQDLDLSDNNFSGTIPGFLTELRLLNLNLSFNTLHGEVPTSGVFQNESAISLEGNRELCGGIAILNLPSCSQKNSNKKDIRKILVPTAIVAAICLAVSACFCVIMYMRRSSQNLQTPAAIFMVPELLRLSYADLFSATGGFSETNILGRGRFGSVYKGSMNDDEHTVVAVKVLNLNIRGASKSLESECNALRGIRHRNLVKILSVCDSIDSQGEDFKALVYEFMANGSLDNWLHQNSSFEQEEEIRTLTTILRLNIAIDIASAVEYLHCGTDSTVIHGDLKPSNILLDQDMVAHVSDFGLAKIISNISGNLPSSNGSSSSAINGTIGYIPPEYGMNSVVSTEGDAYSYGILLLEMFTNTRPTSDSFEGHINLHDFVSSALPNRVMEVVDPFLHKELNIDDKYQACIVSILSFGVRCSKELPSDRMSMTEVVNELKKISNVFLADRQSSKKLVM